MNMKRKSKLMFVVGIVSATIAVALLAVGVIHFLANVEVPSTIVEGADNYKGRTDICKDDYLYSHLLVFPEADTKGIQVQEYYYECEEFIDNSYNIYVKYTMEKDVYEKERERIADISMTYKDRNQVITKVDGASEYTAYVASWDMDHTYEYALFDDETSSIVCVFTQHDEANNELIPKKYHLDENIMKESVGDDFNVYYFKEGIIVKKEVMPEL